MIPYIDSKIRMTMLTGYSFHVALAGIPLGFKKVSSIEEAIETEQISEGGVNHYVHSLRSPVSREKTLVMEKGIPVGNIGIETANETLASQLFKVGNRFPFALIVVCNRHISRISRVYLAAGMMLKSWSLSDLDAMSSDYLIERLEFTYETIERQPLQAVPLAIEGGFAIPDHMALQEANTREEARLKKMNEDMKDREEAVEKIRESLREKREQEQENLKKMEEDLQERQKYFEALREASEQKKLDADKKPEE